VTGGGAVVIVRFLFWAGRASATGHQDTAATARAFDHVVWLGIGRRRGNVCRLVLVMQGVVVEGTVSPGLTYCP
jgi:hypothetical protein